VWSKCTLFYCIPLACAECGDSLPFSGAFSILPYHILFPATLLHQLCFHPPSLRPAIYFLVYLLVLLFPNSYTILFWEFYFALWIQKIREQRLFKWQPVLLKIFANFVVLWRRHNWVGRREKLSTVSMCYQERLCTARSTQNFKDFPFSHPTISQCTYCVHLFS